MVLLVGPARCGSPGVSVHDCARSSMTAPISGNGEWRSLLKASLWRSGWFREAVRAAGERNQRSCRAV